MKKQLITLLFVAACGAVNAQSATDSKATVKENPVMIGKQTGFAVTKAQLTKDPVLRMPEAKKDYHVTGYEISYVPSGGAREVVGPFQVKGDNVNTGRAAEILAKLQPGDRIFFEKITAVCDDGTKPPMKLAAAVKIQ